MDIIHQQQKQRENVTENHHKDERLKQESKEGKQQKSPTSPASPQSNSSSPSHEFSFTISLHSTTTTSSSSSVPTDKTKANSAAASSFAIDLTPADDIFFHGHLLPLHFLSHLPVSPRSSTNSLDSFNLPKKDFLDAPKQQQPEKNNACIIGHNNVIHKSNQHHHHHATKGRNKSMSLSQIILSLRKWRKGYQERGKERQGEEINKEKQKRNLKFEVTQVIKKYARMVRPLLTFKGRRRDDVDQFYDRQNYNSYSGNLSLRRDKQVVMIGKKGQYSAPASMSTSPTNSGLLVATSPFSSSTSDHSTMEELQAAIQAAIAHCKNSNS